MSSSPTGLSPQPDATAARLAHASPATPIMPEHDDDPRHIAERYVRDVIRLDRTTAGTTT